ncbi:MAG: hypothetical protein IJQ62_05370 [Clostridia bacterium]|nr:hypothetical protein [Clostridia bacterium]
MKPLKRALKALIVTLLAYLVQVCVMKYLTFQGIHGSVVFAALAVIIVSCGKKYAFCASCLIGMMMECMAASVPVLYVIAYPVITMFIAQSFADMTDRQLERRQMIIEGFRVRVSEGKVKEHWWQRFMLRYRDSDLPPIVRIPVSAALMDLLMNAVLAVYMYLIGEELTGTHLWRILISMLYTAALSLILMVPLRWILGMYRKRKPHEGGELL